MAKVSIIVPVYNTENYLKKCLDSLVSQTLEDIQIIIVNDGSTDNSQKIIDDFYNKYPKKIVKLSKQNGGLSDARNFAIPYINSRYVAFIDSDDYIEPNMMESMYDVAIKEDIDLVECDFIWEYDKRIKNDSGITYAEIKDYFINGRVMAWNKLIKTSIILDNNIKFPFGLRYEDVEFFYKMVPFIKKHKNINKEFYHYIQRNTSIANTQNEKNGDIFKILDNILEFYKKNNLYNEYKEKIEYLFIRLLLGSSFLRIIKIKDKKIRKELLNKNIKKLYIDFPKWKKNNYLKIKIKKNFYYKTVNKFTYIIYSQIFGILRSKN